jgi:hypothetical protein
MALTELPLLMVCTFHIFWSLRSWVSRHTHTHFGIFQIVFPSFLEYLYPHSTHLGTRILVNLWVLLDSWILPDALNSTLSRWRIIS